MPAAARSNADRFLAAFRTIEDLLSRDAERNGGNHRRAFGELVDGSGRPAVHHFRRELRELQELRNAIVHKATHDGRPIAEPHDETVALIEGIARRMAEPPPALMIAARDVIVCHPKDDVAQVAMRMRARGVSTMPVVDHGEVVGLLTSDTITRWMAAELESGRGLLETAPVREVLAHAEHPDEHAILGPGASAYEALTLFRRGLEHGRPPRAVVITATGTDTGQIRGLLTAADMPRLLELAGALG